MVKTYIFTGFARSNPTRFKAKNKKTLMKRLKKEKSTFSKGLKSYHFIEEKKSKRG